MRGELVIGQGLEVDSESSSDSDDEDNDEEPAVRFIPRGRRQNPACVKTGSALSSRDHGRADAIKVKVKKRPLKLNIVHIKSDPESQGEDSPIRNDTPSPQLSPRTEKAFRLATAYKLSNERKDSLFISLTEMLGMTQSDEDAWENEELRDPSIESYGSVEI